MTANNHDNKRFNRLLMRTLITAIAIALLGRLCINRATAQPQARPVTDSTEFYRTNTLINMRLLKLRQDKDSTIKYSMDSTSYARYMDSIYFKHAKPSDTITVILYRTSAEYSAEYLDSIYISTHKNR